MTTISDNIMHGVMKSIQKLYSRHELEDFIIEIDNTEIKCHRFILASCSEFFCGLFRSGMKEVASGRASLQGISYETFQLILEALYTGKDVITEDNVISIWHASNQLQIDFMIELCEMMVVNILSLDNFEEVYRNAKLIDSKQVLGAIKTFILKHFVHVRKMNTFLELTFDELLSSVSDHMLVVESEDQVLESIMQWIEYPKIEDSQEEENKDVIRICAADIRKNNEIKAQNSLENNNFLNSEFSNLVDHCTSEKEVSSSVVDKELCQPQLLEAKDHPSENCNKEILTEQTDSKTNTPGAQTLDEATKNKPLESLENTLYKVFDERLPKLPSLLNAARTYLASASFLGDLYNHNLINGNHEAKDIIFNAVLYHTEKYKNGTWSKASSHRESSEFGNFGVFCYGEGIFVAYSIVENKFLRLTNCPNCNYSVHLVVFDNELYACGRTFTNDTKSKLFLFRGNVWTKVTELTGPQLFLLSYENTILVFNIKSKIISSIKPKECYKLQENFANLPQIENYENSLKYGSQLLVFYAETVGGIEETAVHCLDLKTKIWTRLDNLEGPAKHLISFQDGENYYIIQRNGNVWRLFNTKDKLVSFNFIGKLWTSDRVLYGAVPFKNQLILIGDSPKNYHEEKYIDLNEFPYTLRHWGRNSDCSNFVPVILAKTCLNPPDK